MYLPIAELSVNILVLLLMGAGVGFLSGMFGVGGGFLMTPLLIFYNIPPAVAVATEANQIVASSFSGALAHFRRSTVDVKLGLILLSGGIIGSLVGIYIFNILRSAGQIDLIISMLYVILLGIIGSLMMYESICSLRRVNNGGSGEFRKPAQHNWIHGLPFKLRFRRSKICLSIIPVITLGIFVGLLAVIMGVGGGFIMVPAMIYLLRVPTNVVIGTSLFQIVFVTAFTTVLHAFTNQTVDISLAIILMIGGVIGAQWGVVAGHKLRAEQLRALLAIMVLLVCSKMGFDLIIQPSELYSIYADAVLNFGLNSG